MGGAGMRNTKARGAVDGLVRTETILMNLKRLQSQQRTSFHAAEMAVPKILHQMLCSAASDQVVAALGCGEREIVFAGSGGLLYPSYDGPNTEMAPAVKVFYTTGQWKYVTKADKLGYRLQEAQDDAQKGTVKVFIAPEELERRQTAGEFGQFFGLIVSEITDTSAWPTLFWPFQEVLQVTEKFQVKAAVRKLLQETYSEMCDELNKLTVTTFFDPTVRMTCDVSG